MKKQTLISLSSEECELLAQRIDANALRDSDLFVLSALVRSYTYLLSIIKEAKIGFNKLRQLCGFLPKKRISKKALALLRAEAELHDCLDETMTCHQDAPIAPSHLEEDGMTPAMISAISQKNTPPKPKSKKPGHGRHSHKAYTNATEIYYTHETLKSGDPCPHACGGKMYVLKPGVFVTLSGNPLVSVTKHVTERLRCSTCQSVVSACRPAGLRKCDASLTTHLALQKYGAGMPFYRQAALQRRLDIPLPASSQYFYIKDNLYSVLLPIFTVLKTIAANGSLIHFDDTRAKILSLMNENEEGEPCINHEESDITYETNLKQTKRTGLFATGILSVMNLNRTVLFLIGKKHSGENLTEILEKRTVNTPLVAMSDAHTTNNIPKTRLDSGFTVWCRCLAHARQKFEDLALDFKEECTVVLRLIGAVYQNDRHTQKEKMDDEARLAYHREKSIPIMLKLKAYLDQLIHEKKVEPNSHLGRAINYTRKNWRGFVMFMAVPGAPLDNNSLERLLKLFVLLRKNAYFFKTQSGADVASCMLSLIATCEQNKVNVYDYFMAVQAHEKQVYAHPECWLPWCYKQTLKEQDALKPPSTSPPPLLQVA